MDLFRVRLNCIDHYQATPTRYDPQLRNDVQPSEISKGTKVPVIRVFGSTETGQKVCAHIHGAFPYMFVEYHGSLEAEEAGAYMYQLHLSIDHALAVSYRRDQFGNNAKFVARITLVKGVPFFGFHVGYRFFLKIYMFNPIVMTRLADLLLQGAIMKQKFQPYEAHLQYLLQFMTDFNLYGCDYLDSRVTRFRSPIPKHDHASNSEHLWHDRSIPRRYVTDEMGLPRVSHCSIEVDICVQDIMNRKKVGERPLHHDFIERTNPISSDVKLVYSMAGLWKDETKRRKRQMTNPSKDSSPFPPEVLISMSADIRDSQPQGWIHEEEFREQIRELISDEKEAGDPALDFGSFALKAPLEHTVKTVLQSVEDLFPSNLMPALGLASGLVGDEDPTSSIVVDEQKVLTVGNDDDDYFPSDSDEEALTILESGKLVSANSNRPDSEMSDNPGLSSSERLFGLCQSGFVTKKLPSLPISKALVKTADRKGYISKAPRDWHGRFLFQNSAPKRPASEILANESHIKRRKKEETPGNKNTDSHEGFKDSFLPSASPKIPRPESSTKARKPSPRTRETSIFHSTLNFAVVKDQNDPNTKLHLSQRSQKSSSQQSDDFRPGKHVSFQPGTFIESSNDQGLSSQPIPKSSASSAGWEEASEVDKLRQALESRTTSRVLLFASLPPSSPSVAYSLGSYDRPDVLYKDPYYSKDKDVPNRIREYAGREFRLNGDSLPFLPDFDATGASSAIFGQRQDTGPDKARRALEYERRGRQCSWKSWELAVPPPTSEEVESWWKDSQRHAAKENTTSPLHVSNARQYLSQIDGPTPNNKHGFKYSQKRKSTSIEHEVQYMSTMSLEIHVNTRGKFVPNPEEDEVQCVFWALKSDEATLSSQTSENDLQSGILVLATDPDFVQRLRRLTSAEVIAETTELDLMTRMVEIVRDHDPDILTGYEVHGGSWGFLIERARIKYDYNLCDEFSRMKTESHGRFGKENDKWGFNTTSTIRVTGRHMINIWRAMRGELNLLQYTMENVAWHLLHRRIPHYPWKVLTSWYKSGKHRELSRVLRYYQSRTRLDMEILEANELVARTSEQARLLGVDFFSVFSRGSQFKVESIMFRIAKPENFVLVSPSKRQVGGQNALECLPLVMEPQSAFYNSPLLVLDFQSLYPSVMIAYNYCYSTFLGRITNWRGMNKMGFSEYKRQQGLLALLQDYINIAPNGMMYAKTEIRKSLLAKMLTEILETRVMVKSGMKQDKDDKTLQQLLNNRQLALKLLANVTYGYTSASFSGRMPCSEIADSIVQTARETLERAIAYIHSVERWGAEVVYGDTDSLFIYLKGRTKDDAFDIGNEIAKAITEMNPRPIKLKFEKVYHPCVLLAKKRYVGYKYESKDQVKPEFDAKGIETVRRDGTPAEQKIEEKVLRMLFETADLSKIKEYFQRQCEKIMRNNVSIQDFCFAKEVRLGTYSDKGLPPAGALISTKRMLEDARAEPQYGERVPYVVITGAPGARLIDRCVAPEELLTNPHWQLDSEYYISKNLIPPLERIFNLVGANVRQWYDEMPKIQRIYHGTTLGKRKTTLESYMRSKHCLVCNTKFTHKGSPLCRACRADVPATLLTLQSRLSTEERKIEEVLSLCRSCSGVGHLEDVKCDSKDCPVFWTRMRQWNKVRKEQSLSRPAIESLVKDVDRLSLEW